MCVRGRARRHNGHWLVSIFLVNVTTKPEVLEAAAWLFQARIAVTAPDGEPVFLARPDTFNGGDEIDRAEQRRLAMACSHNLEIGVILRDPDAVHRIVGHFRSLMQPEDGPLRPMGDLSG